MPSGSTIPFSRLHRVWSTFLVWPEQLATVHRLRLAVQVFRQYAIRSWPGASHPLVGAGNFYKPGAVPHHSPVIKLPPQHLPDGAGHQVAYRLVERGRGGGIFSAFNAWAIFFNDIPFADISNRRRTTSASSGSTCNLTPPPSTGTFR